MNGIPTVPAASRPASRLAARTLKLRNFFVYGLRFGDGPGHRLALVYFFLRGKLIEVLGWRFLKHLPLPARINMVFNGKKLTLHVSKDFALPHIFYEVFVTQDYQVDFASSPKCIFDVGAHVGLTSLYYQCLYPEAVIYAFEPCTDNFRYLQLNTRPFPNIRPFRMGICSQTGNARLFLQNVGIEHSLFRRSGSWEEIRTITLDEFMNARRIKQADLLKIDAEGAEEQILTTTAYLTGFEHLIGELHLELINQESVLKVLERSFDVKLRSTDPHLVLFAAKRKNTALKERCAV